jgi:hypothetical protein
MISTANRRGYVAKFLTRKSRLWLESIRTHTSEGGIARKRRQRLVPAPTSGTGSSWKIEDADSFRHRLQAMNHEPRPLTLKGLCIPSLKKM